MATIINTMDRAAASSKKQNIILWILIKSFLAGVVGYSVFFLTLTVTYQLLFSYFNLESAQIRSTDLIISSIGFLALYSFFLIKEMKRNNFCK
jgi:hypothetical protein